MKNIKFLLLTFVLTIASVSWADAVVVDKVFLKNLEGHKSDNTQLDLPAGQTTIIVEVEDKNAVISCQFVNSSGVVGLEQTNTGKCWGNVPKQNSQDIITVKVQNETGKYIEYRIRQITKTK